MEVLQKGIGRSGPTQEEKPRRHVTYKDPGPNMAYYFVNKWGI